MNEQDLRALFRNPYSLEAWRDFLHSHLGATQLYAKPKPVSVPASEEERGLAGFLIGVMETPDGFRMGLFDFTVTGEQARRRRVGLRNLLVPWLKADYDAALVVFHSGDAAPWRVSLICDLSGAETAAKRFTFVFGDHSSQYRTPVSRFVKLRVDGASVVAFSALREAFSVEALSKEFYGELFEWYLRAVSPEAGVYFPNDPENHFDDRENINIKIIRLVTRVLFVWFIRQKNLVPQLLFDAFGLKSVLKDFDPLSRASGNYYNAILQNLFFGTLNTPVLDEESGKPMRRFAKGKDQQPGSLYRYVEMFGISETDAVTLFERIPYMNGGLFECLDKPKGLEREAFVKNGNREMLYDGFSRNSAKDPKTGHFKRRAFIPNYLFFDTDERAPGLFPLFSRYNFTVEENATNDADVSLDPELLGRVFENLLASYNPETQITARNATGSFYTPREIVDYMVREALDAYMKTVADKPPEVQLKHLLAIKVLDPACGSGAFPMGMLHAIIERARQLGWTGDIYALKLHVIENCIFGVDIQSIAMMITKLRFFISLICEQGEPDWNDKRGNYGVNPLPNLETKFVAANSLIAMKKPPQQGNLFDAALIDGLKRDLHDIRHRYFGARTRGEKRRLRAEDGRIRDELVSRLSQGDIFDAADAAQLASWNPYDQVAVSPFFDPEWMFGIKNGFDVVIGNPPYISAPDQLKSAELKIQRERLAKDPRLNCLVQKWDLYIAFMELSLRHFLRDGGNFAMIVPYPLTNQTYGAKLRKAIVTEFALRQIVDLQGVKVFENATVTNCIPFVERAAPVDEIPIVRIGEDKAFHVAETLSLPEFMPDEKTCVWKTEKEENLLARFKDLHTLGDYCYISEGMKLNADEKTARGEFKKDELISEKKDKIHCREYVEGKDVDRYTLKGKPRYLEYGTSRVPSMLRRPTFSEMYDKPKLMFNILGEMRCMIDFSKLLHSTSIVSAIPWCNLHGVYNNSISSSVKKKSLMSREEMEKLSRNCDLRFLEGLLNSRLASVLLNFIRGGDYHIYANYLRALPIPYATPAEQSAIASLVSRILAAKASDPAADTSAQEAQIDTLVYRLYGLTDEEIAIVEGKA